jgi:hypothetical protein
MICVGMREEFDIVINSQEVGHTPLFGGYGPFWWSINQRGTFVYLPYREFYFVYFDVQLNATMAHNVLWIGMYNTCALRIKYVVFLAMILP